jgi:hypothetical protein
MGKFGLTKRCRCPRRAWTNECPHSWHYKFKWEGRRFRAALDDVLHRHVSAKPEALKEVEKIYEAVRDARSAANRLDTYATAARRTVLQGLHQPEDGPGAGKERTLPLECDDRNESPRPPARRLRRS